MKTKLQISTQILAEIEKRNHVKIIKEANRGFMDFKIGDFVINGHGVAGFIKPEYELSSDIRVNVGGTIQVSRTGENGYDTLEINNFHVFEVEILDYNMLF